MGADPCHNTEPVFRRRGERNAATFCKLRTLSLSKCRVNPCLPAGRLNPSTWAWIEDKPQPLGWEAEGSTISKKEKENGS
jgi:hypothetical protein